jgi:hypothetical protein
MVALEVKLAARVGAADVAHLQWLRARLGGDLLDAAVITTGAEAYRRPDGFLLMPDGVDTRRVEDIVATYFPSIPASVKGNGSPWQRRKSCSS